MKQLITLVGAIAAITQLGWGATICAPGTLATYVALGSNGCMIGTNTLSNFRTLSGITGAVAIAPETIQVTPSGSSASPSLSFGVAAMTRALIEAIFTYRIAGNSFTSSAITLANTSSSGDGVSTYIQDLCGAGIFGPDGVSNCTGTTLGPLVAISNGNDQTAFAGPSFLTVTDDFTLDGGLGGSASGGTFTDRFTATALASVPEPGTILGTCLASSLLVSLKIRSSQKASATNKENL